MFSLFFSCLFSPSRLVHIASNIRRIRKFRLLEPPGSIIWNCNIPYGDQVFFPFVYTKNHLLARPAKFSFFVVPPPLISYLERENAKFSVSHDESSSIIKILDFHTNYQFLRFGKIYHFAHRKTYGHHWFKVNEIGIIADDEKNASASFRHGKRFNEKFLVLFRP